MLDILNVIGHDFYTYLNKMNIDKYIFIAGPTEEQLSSGLQELAELYADTGFTEGILVLKSLKADNQFIINFSNMPDFERFKYFVNFLRYPIETEYTAKVMGYWTVGNSDRLPESLIGKRLLLYVSEKDTDGDNVFAIYEGAKSTIKLGFALGEEYQELASQEFGFVEPQLNSEDYNLVTTVSPDSGAKKKTSGGCASILTLFVFVLLGLYLLN